MQPALELIFDSDDYWHDGLENSEPWGPRLAQGFEDTESEHASAQEPLIPLEIYLSDIC